MTALTAVKKDTMLVFSSFCDMQSAEKNKLASIGLIPGENITVLHDCESGYVTVLVKGSKIALDSRLASKIMVREVKK